MCIVNDDRVRNTLGKHHHHQNINQELFESGSFDWMKKSIDEDEHSIEMQLPYIVKMMQGNPFTLVPILVGSLQNTSESLFGRLLVKYFDDPSNFFVISSDFCHWGKRFDYTYYDSNVGPIFKSIEKLDKDGMDAIETKDPAAFQTYQKKFKNTICGRNPISVLLQIIAHSKINYDLKFVHYAQSSQCTKSSDSSVSYAAAVVTQSHC
eukprot:TRINITY_DN1721_c0_g1_i2.p1 TRINITY_DN1721_c0_g1~~TRINITY_DN1721_c0_g1_i2.p1  ORF type:complete len:208 (-),score=38.71 TRINITY_DN1721_c0_g1_i2:23-646(-)